MIAPRPPRLERGHIYRDVLDKRDEEIEAIGTARLEHAEIVEGELRFATAVGRDRALADGVFVLAIPPGFDPAPGDTFAGQFFAGAAAAPYGRFRDVTAAALGDPLLGFHQRINQIEQFLLERRLWTRHYPPEISGLGEHLTALSRIILHAALTGAGVPAEHWPTATGGCSETRGSYHLTFNHYRPQHAGCGLRSHKDDGFVTVLRTTTPGLEINRRDRWERVPVDDRHFVVNFGLAMELLTAACTLPVAAIMHRVCHQTIDRSSFGHFASSACHPGADQGIYRYLPGHGLERICASRELIDENDHEIYHGTIDGERAP